MYWRRRTTSRIIILLLGSLVMFAEWLSSAGSGYARLRLRSNAYSSDADAVQTEAHGRGYSYFQQPYFHDKLHGHSRQEPDKLGLHESLLHQGPQWSGKWLPAGRGADDNDYSRLTQPFELPWLKSTALDGEAAHSSPGSTALEDDAGGE